MSNSSRDHDQTIGSALNVRRLRVTLELLVSDLPLKVRLEAAAGICFDDETPEEAEAELPRVRDLQASEVARVLESLSHDWVQDELWAGTELFANFDKVTVVNSVWDDAPSSAKQVDGSSSRDGE